MAGVRARAILTAMFFDLALAYDPATRSCDLVLGEDGDLAIDETSITPVLLSIGLDRRAAPDDPLPAGRTEFLAPSSFSERRGGPGDALDLAGERAGSKLWLLDRAKQTETTRLLVEMWLRESLEWARRDTGVPAEIEVTWLRPETLKYSVFVADAELTRTIRSDA